MYGGHKNIKNSFLVKRYFATYVAFATFVYRFVYLYIMMYINTKK